MVVVDLRYVYSHLPEGGRGGGDCTVKSVSLLLVSLVQTERSTVKPSHEANSQYTVPLISFYSCEVVCLNQPTGTALGSG